MTIHCKNHFAIEKKRVFLKEPCGEAKITKQTIDFLANQIVRKFSFFLLENGFTQCYTKTSI